MKIECLRRRPKGTVVTIGTETYHFRPENSSDGPHVADVTIKAHVTRFLEIKEGYRRLAGEKPAKGDSDHQTGTTDTTITPGTDNAGNQQTNTGNGEGQNDSGNDNAPYLLEGTSDDDLRAIFEKEVGRKPSPKAGRDTMIAQIKAALEANAA
ncbi:hypothetical protein Q0601_15080 [Paracoccus onubensis]|uniref:hypothetical protein n=1 Tax=Paracoccus onubensis TaxID=1675788 RepID=UPI00272F1993|nr:hypothetical protein [Paracoccus onubensis]MDP0928508.1 hypothetical protein [Paracoccus onubensis]